MDEKTNKPMPPAAPSPNVGVPGLTEEQRTQLRDKLRDLARGVSTVPVIVAGDPEPGHSDIL